MRLVGGGVCVAWCCSEVVCAWHGAARRWCVHGMGLVGRDLLIRYLRSYSHHVCWQVSQLGLEKPVIQMLKREEVLWQVHMRMHMHMHMHMHAHMHLHTCTRACAHVHQLCTCSNGRRCSGWCEPCSVNRVA